MTKIASVLVFVSVLLLGLTGFSGNKEVPRVTDQKIDGIPFSIKKFKNEIGPQVAPVMNYIDPSALPRGYSSSLNWYGISSSDYVLVGNGVDSSPAAAKVLQRLFSRSLQKIRDLVDQGVVDHFDIKKDEYGNFITDVKINPAWKNHVVDINLGNSYLHGLLVIKQYRVIDKIVRVHDGFVAFFFHLKYNNAVIDRTKKNLSKKGKTPEKSEKLIEKYKEKSRNKRYRGLAKIRYDNFTGKYVLLGL